MEEQQELGPLEELARAIEAVLFAAPEPQSLEALRKGLGASGARVAAALDLLASELQQGKRGIRLQRHGDQAQLVTAPELAPELERFFGYEGTARLSAAALETLAIIAYRQPTTRAQVEAVRGVDSSGVINTLLSRNLITEAGRLETAGHPILYGTTPVFLRHFGLNSLSELPPMMVNEGAAAQGTRDAGKSNA